jgi:hypothetical protein
MGEMRLSTKETDMSEAKNYVGRTIYIDDIPRLIVVQTHQYIHVDHPDAPGVACSQHRMTPTNLESILEANGSMFTSGCLYANRARKTYDTPTPTPTPPKLQAPVPKPALVKRIKAAIEAFKNPR